MCVCRYMCVYMHMFYTVCIYIGLTKAIRLETYFSVTEVYFSFKQNIFLPAFLTLNNIYWWLTLFIYIRLHMD